MTCSSEISRYIHSIILNVLTRTYRFNYPRLHGNEIAQYYEP